MVHYMKYFQRISREPTLYDIEYTSTFKESIDAERVQVDIQKHNADESDSLKKSADLWKLKKQK